MKKIFIILIGILSIGIASYFTYHKFFKPKLEDEERWAISFGLYGNKPLYTLGALKNKFFKPKLEHEEKRAISFGLYGNKPLYTLGALKNAELMPRFYPGWRVVFYVDEKTVPSKIIQGLKDRGALVITEGKYNGTMFGRFMIADHPDFDRFIVRDADSRPSKREAKAVNEWIRSGKLMHNIRDHEKHDIIIMGGLWGGKKGFLHGKKMANLIAQWEERYPEGELEKREIDQSFLGEVIVPIVKVGNILSHDSYTCKKYPNSIPFFRPHNFFDFAGQVYQIDKNGNDIPFVPPGKDGPPECNLK